jgi:hypothetical protein
MIPNKAHPIMTNPHIGPDIANTNHIEQSIIGIMIHNKMRLTGPGYSARSNVIIPAIVAIFLSSESILVPL